MLNQVIIYWTRRISQVTCIIFEIHTYNRTSSSTSCVCVYLIQQNIITEVSLKITRVDRIKEFTSCEHNLPDTELNGIAPKSKSTRFFGRGEEGGKGVWEFTSLRGRSSFRDNNGTPETLGVTRLRGAALARR